MPPTPNIVDEEFEARLAKNFKESNPTEFRILQAVKHFNENVMANIPNTTYEVKHVFQTNLILALNQVIER